MKDIYNLSIPFTKRGHKMKSDFLAPVINNRLTAIILCPGEEPFSLQEQYPFPICSPGPLPRLTNNGERLQFLSRECRRALAPCTKKSASGGFYCARERT